MIDLRDCGLDAEAVRKALELAPHPEGGAYREIWRDAPQDRAGAACLDSAPRKLSGFLPGYAERGAERFFRGGGRA
jgi:hypothetical protein